MKPQWNPTPQVIKSPEQRYNEMLSGATENQIVEVDPSICHEIDNQSFEINSDKVDELAESITQYGQIDPIHIVPSQKFKGEYDILAGRHRNRACKKASIKVKAIIEKNNDKMLSRAKLLITNLHRNNNYKPSELAYAYKELAEIQKSSGNKATVAQVAKQNNMSNRQINRYIKLCDLIPQLLDKVDENEISFLTGVELAYFEEDGQKEIFDMMERDNQFKPSLELIKDIRAYKSKPTQKDVYDFFHATIESEIKPVEESQVHNIKDKTQSDGLAVNDDTAKTRNESAPAKQQQKMSANTSSSQNKLQLSNEEECRTFLQKYTKWTLITSLSNLNLAFYEYCFQGYRLIAMQYLCKDKESKAKDYKKSVKIFLLRDGEVFNIYSQVKLDDIIQKLLEIINKDRKNG